MAIVNRITPEEAAALNRELQAYEAEMAKYDNEGSGGIKIGIASGKYSIPDDIDDMNDAIAEMFDV